MKQKIIIGLDSELEKNSDIIYSDMDEEIVMMSIERGEYYGIDPVGARIWELIQTHGKVSTICDKLMEEYNVTQEKCISDVLRFLTKLSEKNIISVSDD